MLTNSWQFWALLSAAFAALMTIFAKMSLQRVDPDLAQLLRTAVVLVAIAIPVMAANKLAGIWQWTGQTWLYLILSGLATAASWICYFRALNVGDASRVAAVDKVSIVIVAVVAAVVLHERLGIIGWSGIGLVAMGLAMLSMAK